jgi:hypothetical protein
LWMEMCMKTVLMMTAALLSGAAAAYWYTNNQCKEMAVDLFDDEDWYQYIWQ